MRGREAGPEAVAEQEAKRVAAAAYDYVADPRWADYWSNVLVPPHLAAHPDVLAHFRPKFYQCFLVTLNKHAHFCSSTAKVVTKMASYHWVAEKAIPFLKKEPNMGAKKLQKELQDKYQVTIGYSTVWAGREIAATKIWGTWEDSFGYKGDKKPRGKGLYQVQCKTCKNFGHRASSSKCAFNGTKKRKSRAKQGGPRGPKRKKSQLEAIPNAESNAAPSTPPSTIVHQEPVTGQANCSPGPVTRSQYQLTIHGGSPTKNSPRPKTRSQTHEAGEGSHMNVNTPTKTRKQTTRKANKKLTPRRAKK